MGHGGTGTDVRAAFEALISVYQKGVWGVWRFKNGEKKNKQKTKR